MPITALNHFLLVAKNLERTKDFYCRVLGFEVAAERPDFGFPGYWLKANGEISVHLASQVPNKIRDTFLLKRHPRGTAGSGQVDHIAFLAKDAEGVRSRIRKNKVEMHYRSFPDAAPPLFVWPADVGRRLGLAAPDHAQPSRPGALEDLEAGRGKLLGQPAAS